MKNQSLLGALPILAKFLGRTLGVQVVVGGGRAQTDGRTIVLPPLPDDDQARLLANGYIDHEGAHIRYTDFAVPSLPTPLGRTLQNVLEDVRIERALGQALPGCQQNLARLMAHLVATGEARLPPSSAPPAQWVLAYLSYRLSADVLRQAAVRPLAEAAEAQVRSLLPEGVMVKLNALAFAVTQARNTQAVTDLSRRIVQMLAEEAQPPDPPPEERAGVGQGSGSPGQERPGHDESVAAPARGNRTGPPSAGDTALEQPAADSADPSGATTPAGDEAQQTPLTAGAADVGAGAAGAGEVLRQLVASTAEDLASPLLDRGRQLTALLEQAAQNADTAEVMAEPDPVPKGAPSASVLAQARRATAALRRQLAVLVEASRQEHRWRGPRGHRLNGRELYRLSCSDAGIFQRRAAIDAPATAVMLLLDRSGSMRDRIALAHQATLAVAVALQEIAGCTVGVGAFPGSTADRVIPLLGYDEKVTRVAGRFQIDARGGTPLAPALLWAGYQLLLQPPPRKLLLVITDGAPDEFAACQAVIQRCRASGLEVMGLGIDALPAVNRLFGQDAENITAIDELAPQLFQLLQRRLTGSAA